MNDASEEGDDLPELQASGGARQGSPEEAPIGEGEGGGDQPSTSKKVSAKFLVSNAAAGSIIGRAGSNISQLQQQSGARLQLSRSHEYFPGTQDRIMLATGTVNQILTALHLVLTKVQSEQAVAETMMAKDGKGMQLRMLVPTALCGTIIGKSGAIIRGFAEDSKAAITVSGQDRQPPGVSDRVVRISGHADHLMRAVALLLTKLSEHPNFGRFTQYSIQFNAMQPGYQFQGEATGPGAQHLGSRPGQQGRRQQHVLGDPGQSGPRIEIVLGVPESRVGAVIGRGGEVINQLKTVVGVKIRVSERDDFLPGTRNRKITISGPETNVAIAETLINQRINQAASATS